MTFEQCTPDVVKLESYDQMKTYRNYNIAGTIIEAWDRDDEGVWHDVTLREQEIQKLQRIIAATKKQIDKEVDKDGSDSRDA